MSEAQRKELRLDKSLPIMNALGKQIAQKNKSPLVLIAIVTS